MENFATRLWNSSRSWFRSLFSLHDSKRSKTVRLHLLICETRAEALKAIRSDDIVALVGAEGHYKWAQMKCPCGCGDILALNLMKSHSPRWEISILDKKTFSFTPSIDSTVCGAHFWLRDGSVIWCD